MKMIMKNRKYVKNIYIIYILIYMSIIIIIYLFNVGKIVKIV